MYEEEQTTLPLSSLVLLLAMMIPVGYAALHTDSEELLDDSRTSTALAIFLLLGFLMMRFDFVDAVEEEAEKEGSHSVPAISLIPAWSCLMLACGVAAAIALSGSIHYEHEFVIQQLFLYAADLKHALLRDLPMWTALALFSTLGAAVMRCDFADALEEERQKHGMESSDEQSSSSAGRWLLILGSAVALVVAVAAAWGQGSPECVGGPLFVEELQSHATDAKDALSLTVAMLLLGDTPTWTALALFLMFGAIITRFDFIDALKEESHKEGLDLMGDHSLIPGGRLWLVLGSGVGLALAGYHRWQISGHMAQEVSIFFLSAVLAIGLASTISNSPKSTIARAFAPPVRSK